MSAQTPVYNFDFYIHTLIKWGNTRKIPLIDFDNKQCNFIKLKLPYILKTCLISCTCLKYSYQLKQIETTCYAESTFKYQ